MPAIEATAVGCNPMKSILPCFRTAHVLPRGKYNHTSWSFAIQHAPENMHIISLCVVFVLFKMFFYYFQILSRVISLRAEESYVCYSVDEVILKHMGMIYRYFRTTTNTINNWSKEHTPEIWLKILLKPLPWVVIKWNPYGRAWVSIMLHPWGKHYVLNEREP